MTTRKFAVAVTTNGSGAATSYSPYLSGRLTSIQYVKPGSGGFADGSSITVTSDTTGQSIWAESAVNASAVRYPRAATCTTAGVASLYAAAGTAVNDVVRLSRDRVKIVIASGGDTRNATFNLIVEDD